MRWRLLILVVLAAIATVLVFGQYGVELVIGVLFIIAWLCVSIYYERASGDSDLVGDEYETNPRFKTVDTLLMKQCVTRDQLEEVIKNFSLQFSAHEDVEAMFWTGSAIDEDALISANNKYPIPVGTIPIALTPTDAVIVAKIRDNAVEYKKVSEFECYRFVLPWPDEDDARSKP